MGSMLGSQKTQATKEGMETALNKTKQIAASSPVFVFRLFLFLSNLSNMFLLIKILVKEMSMFFLGNSGI